MPAHLLSLLAEAPPLPLKRCRPCAPCSRAHAGWGLRLLLAAMLAGWRRSQAAAGIGVVAAEDCRGNGHFADSGGTVIWRSERLQPH